MKLIKIELLEMRLQLLLIIHLLPHYCQRPIELGADFTVHSLTKGMGGFGTDMGGVVIGKNKYRDALLAI